METTPAPEKIQAIGDEIAILWADSRESFYRMELLRAASPSAANMGERDLLGVVHGGSGQTEFPGIRVTRWEFIGGYALRFHFSDGHNTGIFSFQYLRQLDELTENDADG